MFSFSCLYICFVFLDLFVLLFYLSLFILLLLLFGKNDIFAKPHLFLFI